MASNRVSRSGGNWSRKELEALDALANQAASLGRGVDPHKVKEWGEQLWQELSEFQVIA